MPTFCRHNRFVQNCPICSRQLDQPGASGARRPATASASAAARAPRRGGAPRRSGQVRVRQVARAADDGYRNPLVPGLKASADALRLAEELAFAAARLAELRADPPGLYAEVAAEPDPEEAIWLAFLIAYLGPQPGADPFGGIAAARTTWASGAVPSLAGARCGPRTAHDPERGDRTLRAYRAWAERAGSQQAALAGEPAWTPERRFARAFERLALPGLHRAARFDFLATLGALGVVDLAADALHLGPDNPVTLAAKRVFAIGDPLLLERRSAALAEAGDLPVAALDLALENWAQPPTRPRITQGASAAVEAAEVPESLADALDL